MIPKVIKNKRQLSGTAGIKKLVDYISEKSSQKLNEVISENSLSHTNSENLTNYITRNNSKFKELPSLFDDTYLLYADGISVMHNLDCNLQDAAYFMAGTATNAKYDKPMMHYVLSWQANETPSDKEIFESALFTLKALGLQDHQYVCAIHNDTDNIHVHIAVNRVHPITHRVNICSNSYRILHQACRILELKHGFKHDNGAYIVNDNNQIVRNKNYKKEGEKPENIIKMEHYTGRQSMIDYFINEPQLVDRDYGKGGEYLTKGSVLDAIKKDINECSNWYLVNDAFQRAGFTLERSQHANGLLIIHEQHGVKTKVSWSRLFNQKGYDYQSICARFGHEFCQRSTPKEIPLIYGREYSNDAMLRERDYREIRRTERLEQRILLRGRYKQYKSALPVFVLDKVGFKASVAQISEQTRAIKRRIKEQYLDPIIRKQFYNVAEFERYRKIAALKLENQQERNDFYAKNPKLNYQQWVEKEALNGDSGALSQLRGWHYSKQRKESTKQVIIDNFDPKFGKEQPNVLLCHERPDFPCNSNISHYNLQAELHRNGNILYRDIATDLPQLLDRGETIVCAKACNENAQLGAMGIAVKDCKATKIELIGDDNFKRNQFSNYHDYCKISPNIARILIKTYSTEVTTQKVESEQPQPQKVWKTGEQLQQEEYARQAQFIREHGYNYADKNGNTYKPK